MIYFYDFNERKTYVQGSLRRNPLALGEHSKENSVRLF